jgi:hypothetical protein
MRANNVRTGISKSQDLKANETQEHIPVHKTTNQKEVLLRTFTRDHFCCAGQPMIAVCTAHSQYEVHTVAGYGSFNLGDFYWDLPFIG